MKKITIIAVAAFAVSFASCKKARTCTCTDSNGDKTIMSYDKMSSGDANAKCPKTMSSSYSTKSNSTGTVLSSGSDVSTCVLS